VILQRTENYETLRLNNTSMPSSGKTPTTHTLNTQDSSPSRLLGNFQRQLSNNPEILSKLLRIDPANENGKFIGFRLSAGQDPSLMTRFDLQPGDILTAVNGINLDSPLKGLSIVQQLSTASQLNLQVMRQGQFRNLSFTVEK
jgi:general secretion pathway protein C